MCKINSLMIHDPKYELSVNPTLTNLPQSSFMGRSVSYQRAVPSPLLLRFSVVSSGPSVKGTWSSLCVSYPQFYWFIG